VLYVIRAGVIRANKLFKISLLQALKV